MHTNRTNQTVQQQQQFIGSFIGKLLRDSFGKGPESVYVSIAGSIVTVYIRNFITSSERILLDHAQEELILRMRDKLMATLLPEISRYIGQMTGIVPAELYYDWRLDNRNGMLVALLPQDVPCAPAAKAGFEGKENLERELIRLQRQEQKAPEQLTSYEINQRTLVIIQNGILVTIEKELYKLGYGELLKKVKRTVSAQALWHGKTLEAILRKPVIDTFIDWDYAQDKSVMVLVMNPNIS